MQNFIFIVNPARVPIPQNLEIGKLIGRNGRNLKPIAAETGTFIVANTNTNPAQFEIKINQESDISSLSSPRNQIKEAKDRLNDLINLEKENKRCHLEEEKRKYVAYLDDFDSNRHEVLKYQKEINVKKQKRKIRREIMSTINSYMRGEVEEYGEFDDDDDNYDLYY